MTGSDSGVGGVLLITVDSLRADAVGGNTPALDGLKERGTDFRQAYAHGNWTPFSFPSVLGSDEVFADGDRVGPSTAPTLAERLQAAGVRTGGFNAANGFLTRHWGYDRGFDEFDPMTGGARTPVGRFLDAHPTVRGWLEFAGWPLRAVADRVQGRTDGVAVDTSKRGAVERRARSFLQGADDERFFCWVHLMDTHTPYVPAPRHLREVGAGRSEAFSLLRGHLRAGLGREVDDDTLAALRTAYEAAARGVDETVERLLETLSATGRREDTLVVVAGDHGEEFLEHGHLAHYPKVYDELAHVPLVVDHPEGDGRTVETPVGLSAVPATVCDALGLPTEGLAGDSVAPVAVDDATPSDEPVTTLAVRGESVTEQPIPRRLTDGNPVVAARTDRWTFVRNAAADEEELYDRAADPTEQDDRAADPPGDAPLTDLRRAASRRLDRLESEESTDGDRDDGDVDGDLQRRLEALGYA
ncbi:MAG: sulfatase [Halolamina sp.]